MKRLFSFRLNADDLTAEILSLSEDQHGPWLRGFLAGLHGRASQGVIGPYDAGMAFGFHMHREAAEHQKQQSEYGKKSGDVSNFKGKNKPQTKPGTPEAPSGHPGGTPQPTPEAPSNQSSNPVIHVSNGTSKPILHPAVRAEKKVRSPQQEQVARLQLKLMGNVNEKKTALKMAIDEFGLDYVAQRMETMKQIWPNQLMDRLKDDKLRPEDCPYPAGSSQALDWYVLNDMVIQ